jgi:hypothetical protein
MPRTGRGSLYPVHTASIERRGPREGSPGCRGRAAELGEARALAELAVGVYVPDRRELSAASYTADGLSATFLAFGRCG